MPEYLLEMSTDQLAAVMDGLGERPFRARQLLQWVFEKRAASFDEMTSLGKNLRERLSQHLSLFSSQIVHHATSPDQTDKLLLAMADGESVECVLLREAERRTACISTQVGCAMGCVFCASGLDGLKRNLSRGEIIEQVLRIAHLVEPDQRLSHIVVMGMGEPLANRDNVLSALDAISASEGFGISPRRITISTVGLPDEIRRMADDGVKYHLAVSLHAAEDTLRQQLVPMAKKHSNAEIVAAVDYHFEKTGRRPTFEYALLGGTNDMPECARAMIRLLRGRPAMINVIPFNPVQGLPWKAPTDQARDQFCQILEEGGLNVNLRRRKGDKINAACGQLRRSVNK